MPRILEELRVELLQLEKELEANSFPESYLDADREDQLFSQIARYLVLAAEDIFWSEDFVEAITSSLEPVPLPDGFAKSVLERIHHHSVPEAPAFRPGEEGAVDFSNKEC